MYIYCYLKSFIVFNRMFLAFLFIIFSCNDNAFSCTFPPSTPSIVSGHLHIAGVISDMRYPVSGCFPNPAIQWSSIGGGLVSDYFYYCPRYAAAKILLNSLIAMRKDHCGASAPLIRGTTTAVPPNDWGLVPYLYRDHYAIYIWVSPPHYVVYDSGSVTEYVFAPYGGFGCLQCKADLALAKTRITSEASSILTLYNNSYQGFTKLLPCNSLICLSDYPSYFSAIANSVPILGLFAATMIVFRRKRQPRKTQGK